MIKSNYHIIGVMSGTSLDGIDVCYMALEKKDRWSFHILQSETIPYSDSWLNKLKTIVACPMEDIRRIDDLYTDYLALQIREFIRKYDIQRIDAICSHGHTVFHQPEKGMTYQIGNLEKLATLTNLIVVCDFRTQDVDYGGQGAPLVPIGDHLLFGHFDYCLNLGGFANISFIENDERRAFDICPVNIVMNHYARTLGLEYDKDGSLARSGVTNYDLLIALNALDFYGLDEPKSLGIEWVLSDVIPLMDSFNLSVKDYLCTFIDHIVVQIGKTITQKVQSTMLVTGGGAYNSYLIDKLNQALDLEIIIPSNDLLEFKEALIFGLLGVLKLRNEVNCLKSVTGASRDHSSGKIFHP